LEGLVELVAIHHFTLQGPQGFALTNKKSKIIS
jgi:hypothetical protein